jgi:hypothetical protein
LLRDFLIVAFGCDSFGVTGEGGDEGGHVLAALEPRKLRSALSMPAAAHRLTMVPLRQRLTLRMVSRPMEIIDSIMLVLGLV